MALIDDVGCWKCFVGKQHMVCETAADIQVGVKVDPSVPRDEVWFETRTERVKIVNLAEKE